MNEQGLGWDDLRTALAVARAGSLSGAARRLGVNHATVYRRLGNLEQRLGVRLFERARTGYAATPAGEELAALAERLEAELTTAERRLLGRDLRPSGTVRVTTTDTLLFGLLTPIFGAFRRAHRDITLDVAVSNLVFNLSKRDADVAIRPSPAPPETLVGRKVADIGMAVYAAKDHPAASQSTPDLATFDWIGPDDSLSHIRLARWMVEHRLDARAKYRVDTLIGLLDAARTGLGLAVLPCYLGDPEPGLARVRGPIDALQGELWLLTHPDLRKAARIRTFVDFMFEELRARKDLFTGRG